MADRVIARLVVAAIRGGSGKTVLTLGMVRALRRRGLAVAPFKKGPDYIDAAWLAFAAGADCGNLDPYLVPAERLRAAFSARSGPADLALVEGNRGVFDGVDAAGTYSTAELAKLLGAPVVLVLDCAKMTRTAAAVVQGVRHFDPDLSVGGVILNRTGGARHVRVLRDAVERYGGLPVLGAFPRLDADPLPMRHLGVTPLAEHPEADRALDRLAEAVAERVDLDGLLELAQGAGPFDPGAGEA
ncbi:cobyrinate a,c-diamide synthase, partial [Dissulfurirhabdus thermomarina]